MCTALQRLVASWPGEAGWAMPPLEIEISWKFLEIVWLFENVKCGNVKSAMLSVKTLFGPVQ